MRGWYLGAAALGVLSGCSVYHARPLDSASVAEALRPVPVATVRIAAAQVDHVLIKPMTIDGVLLSLGASAPAPDPSSAAAAD